MQCHQRLLLLHVAEKIKRIFIIAVCDEKNNMKIISCFVRRIRVKRLHAVPVEWQSSSCVCVNWLKYQTNISGGDSSSNYVVGENRKFRPTVYLFKCKHFAIFCLFIRSWVRPYKRKDDANISAFTNDKILIVFFEINGKLERANKQTAILWMHINRHETGLYMVTSACCNMWPELYGEC